MMEANHMDVTEPQHEWLAEQFETHRTHLRAVAYRMLGSSSEADDAVQEAWLRLSRSSTSDIDNLGGWLTTVVGRVCLDMLRSRRSRREEQMGELVPEPLIGHEQGPEHETVMADSVGLALLVVLETLAPAERLAFVLHDLFGVSFEEIAPVVDRSPAAARQLASRARRRVQGASPTDSEAPDPARHREIVEAFLAASRNGDLSTLLSLLDPEVILRADATVVRRPRANLQAEVRGAPAVAEAFAGRAHGADSALIDGSPGAVWIGGGRPRAVFAFTLRNDKIVGIDLVGDPGAIDQMDIEVFSA
jgi:RNA polymerase sigma-70 factor (ECF subfamily)